MQRGLFICHPSLQWRRRVSPWRVYTGHPTVLSAHMACRARPKASEDSVSWVACRRNNLSLRNACNSKISKWSMMKLGSRKIFKYLIQDNRRSFGKNHIYCPLQGHSTTDYVLSKALAPVFSTGFVSDNGCDRGGGMRRM